VEQIEVHGVVAVGDHAVGLVLQEVGDLEQWLAIAQHTCREEDQ